MLVLGIESTCDETGIALVKDGQTILSNLVASQTDLHEAYGGVVPELASRRHIHMLPLLLQNALKETQLTLREIDLIAVAKGPGLVGALLIGLHFAKGLALSRSLPLIGVNHVEAHLFAAMMQAEVALPALGVVLSGGHTALVLINELGSYQLLGQTQDDAIGEAFDKVAIMLGLAYPGGPKVEKLAKGGNPTRFAFKTGRTKNRPFDFSFSGLKTAVLYQVKGQNGTSKGQDLIREEDKKDVAASFQHVAFSDIVNKSLSAAKQYQVKSIVIGGGVSQNGYLRALLNAASPLPLFWPHPELCLDNAAMIGALGFHDYQRRGADDLHLEAMPRIPFIGLPCSHTS